MENSAMHQRESYNLFFSFKSIYVSLQNQIAANFFLNIKFSLELSIWRTFN